MMMTVVVLFVVDQLCCANLFTFTHSLASVQQTSVTSKDFLFHLTGALICCTKAVFLLKTYANIHERAPIIVKILINHF